MEGYSFLCFESLMAHVVCDSIEFPGNVLVGYRALQMLFQFPDFVSSAHCMLGGILILSCKEPNYDLAIPKDPD